MSLLTVDTSHYNPRMFSNSQSTSLSNYSQRPFPWISIVNNLNDQHILLKHLNVTSISAVVEWSMCGMQALHWGTKFPSFFKSTQRNYQGGKIIAICATASVSTTTRDRKRHFGNTKRNAKRKRKRERKHASSCQMLRSRF
ncbi:hypothetical protein RUND412_008264 [Rhizina undulata]